MYAIQNKTERCSDAVREWAKWSLIALFGISLATGCQPTNNKSTGVELVPGSEVPRPGMTFELRFEETMVRASEIGEIEP